MKECSDSQIGRFKFLKDIVRPFFLGLVSGYFVSLLAILVLSFLFSLAGSINFFIFNAISLILVSVCSFVSGFVTLIHFKCKGLIIGSLSGLLVFLVSLFICCVFFGNMVPSDVLLRFFCAVLSGAIGGVLSVNKH